MWIEQWNVSAKLAKASDDERSWLAEYLSFKTKFYRSGGRPEERTTRLLNPFDRTFPSGLVSKVRQAASEEGIVVEVVDRRSKPALLGDEASLAWLRDYQVGAVDAVRKHTRGILWLPTGAGKTEIAVGLTRALPVRWGFLVHRGNLMDAAATRYEARTGMAAGRIGEGRWALPDDGRFTAATFQTIATALDRGDTRAQEWLASLDGIMVDECHVLPADSFTRVVTNAPNAYYRVGLSGTPLARGDKRSLLAIASLGPVIYRIKTDTLIERGVLARPKVRLATVLQGSSKATWQGVYGECVVRSSTRNDTIVALTKRAAKPAFVFVQQMAHGRELVKRLGRAGVNAEFVYGTHSIDARKSLVKRLVAGHFDVLVCSTVFNEGVDVPELRSVVIASGGQSTIATLQRLGRGMRVERDASGEVIKDAFEVYDIADKGNTWLERHSRERLRAYAAEGFETIVEAPGVA
jgi:superfamily II DNA or RNA helicase